MLLTKKQNGFTLAEILITLGIIGVVAAMTIPPLMNKTNDSELRNSYKKVYSEVSQAAIKMALDNGGTLEGLFTDTTNSMKNQFKPYLNTVSDCDDGTSAGICWHAMANWKSYSGSSTHVNVNNRSALVLNNGALITFSGASAAENSACSAVCGSVNRCGYLIVDVNGFKKPNVIGQDIFFMNIQKNKISPSGITGDCDDANCGTAAASGGARAGVFAGAGCGDWVIENKDY